jgi:CRISPR system Cascade subunit CasD
MAVTLIGEGTPSISDLADALDKPARPLFIGRKPCLPAVPILLKVVTAQDVLDALLMAPCFSDGIRRNPDNEIEACWPADIVGEREGREVIVYDRRDWKKQIHAGARRRREGLIRLEEEES